MKSFAAALLFVVLASCAEAKSKCGVVPTLTCKSPSVCMHEIKNADCIRAFFAYKTRTIDLMGNPKRTSKDSKSTLLNMVEFYTLLTQGALPVEFEKGTLELLKTQPAKEQALARALARSIQNEIVYRKVKKFKRVPIDKSVLKKIMADAKAYDKQEGKRQKVPSPAHMLKLFDEIEMRFVSGE